MTGHWTVDFPVPADGLPLGPITRIPGDHTYQLRTTYVRWPLSYVLVSTEPSAISSVPDQALDETLEVARRYVASCAAVTVSAAVPKVALVTSDREFGIFLRTRIAAGAGWHPRIASSGLLALAIAMLDPRTVPARIAGPLKSVATIGTPAGPRSIERRDAEDGVTSVRLVLDRVEPLGGTT